MLTNYTLQIYKFSTWLKQRLVYVSFTDENSTWPCFDLKEIIVAWIYRQRLKLFELTVSYLQAFWTNIVQLTVQFSVRKLFPQSAVKNLQWDVLSNSCRHYSTLSKYLLHNRFHPTNFVNLFKTCILQNTCKGSICHD